MLCEKCKQEMEIEKDIVPIYKNILKQLDVCPSCGSGDIEWEAISVRPYCRDCNFWGYTNFGTVNDAIEKWNNDKRRN